MVHLDGASVGLPTPGSLADVTAGDAWRIIVESFTIVGVNCFTLISGYFGIHASAKGLLRFTLMCMVYSVGIYSAAGPVQGFSWQGWIESWMVFTHTDLWYVPAYMLLYLISPMLNTAVEYLQKRRFTLWLALFIVANVWCGWVWDANFNPTGYTPIQLIMMYLIGRWLSARLPQCKDSLRFMAGISYLSAVALTALIAVWMQPGKVYAYNSPWVIISSVSLFIFFTTLQLQSSRINALARGAFAAYLIHKNPAIWGGLIRPLAIIVWDLGSLWVYTGFVLGFTVVIYLVSAAVDEIRARLFRLVKL